MCIPRIIKKIHYLYRQKIDWTFSEFPKCNLVELSRRLT